MAWTPPPGSTFAPATVLISVTRLGDVVTVVYVEGWEGIDADPGIADRYTGLAVAAITVWRSRSG